MVTTRDAAAMLDIVQEGMSANGTEIFPRSVLERLARLIPSDALAGYQEVDVSRGCELVARVDVVGQTVPAQVVAASKRGYHEDPLRDPLRVRESRVLRLADFVRRSELRRLRFYAEVWRPLGIDDRLRMWLPAPNGRARAFFFERSGRAYAERDRTLLQLLRPHLIRIERSAAFRRSAKKAFGLTDREAEVLGWVHNGKTNREIAAVLQVSPYTVRTHLESVFDKLDVHTRTAAAARFAAIQVAGHS